jgi:hypothetical protein
MPEEEKLTSHQDLAGGDGSNNYQAGGDIHVHNPVAPPAPASSIVRPTDEQIAKFDSKTAEIISAARKMWQWSMAGALVPLGGAIMEAMKALLAMLR